MRSLNRRSNEYRSRCWTTAASGTDRNSEAAGLASSNTLAMTRRVRARATTVSTSDNPAWIDALGRLLPTLMATTPASSPEPHRGAPQHPGPPRPRPGSAPRLPGPGQHRMCQTAGPRARPARAGTRSERPRRDCPRADPVDRGIRSETRPDRPGQADGALCHRCGTNLLQLLYRQDQCRRPMAGSHHGLSGHREQLDEARCQRDQQANRDDHLHECQTRFRAGRPCIGGNRSAAHGQNGCNVRSKSRTAGSRRLVVVAASRTAIYAITSRVWRGKNRKGPAEARPPRISRTRGTT